MKEYMEYYQRNKHLDKMYEEKYGQIDDKCYEKNCLELIVEICELCNESKCFKYWTIKKPDRKLLLGEYADCLSMVFYMFNYYNIEEFDLVDMDLSDDIVVAFNDIIRMCTMLMNDDNVNEDLLMKIFTYLYHIGKLLGIDDKEILDACYMNLGKNIERLNSDY